MVIKIVATIVAMLCIVIFSVVFGGVYCDERRDTSMPKK